MMSNLWNLLNLSGFVKILYDIYIVEKYFLILCSKINSQAPDVPELAHQGIFQLSRLSVNFCQNTEKYPLHLNRTYFMKILSVLCVGLL